MESTRGYARNGTVHLAYEARGVGPPDLLYVNTSTIAFEAMEDEPHAASFFERLAGFTRLVQYDRRGVGRSDPIDVHSPFDIDDTADDALAVLDALGIEQAVIVGEGGGAAVAIRVAARRPDRVTALGLINGWARLSRTEGYPIGHPSELIDGFLAQNTDPDEQWQSDAGDDDLALIAPSMAGDPVFTRWWREAGERGASPAAARMTIGVTARADVRGDLSAVTAPTLVVHRAGSLFVPVELGRHLASHIAGATYVELDGADFVPYTASGDEILDAIEDFLTGRRSGRGRPVLVTVLFTDIVDSTRRAAELGDHAWRAVLDAHDALSRAELTRFGGRAVNTTGDGFFGAFDRPSQAIACAQRIVAAAAAVGVDVRAGIHTGEAEQRGDDLAGLTIHIAARVSAAAGPGEVLVSRTVRDLVAGSSLSFSDRGTHQLKGLPEPWQLYAVDAPGT